MKKNSTFTKFLFVLLAAVFVLACNAIFGGGADTPAPTNPPQPVAPINTSSPVPTKPPQPTATEVILDTPTPAPVGVPVTSNSFEVTVVTARELNRVYMGNYYYYPQTGQIFVEMIVKVSNLTGSKVNIPWENVYVIEKSGDKWYPTWGGYKAVTTGRTVDGSTIGVNEIVDGKATLDFEEDAILRTIWFLSRNDPTTILFGFDDSPNIEVMIE